MGWELPFRREGSSLSLSVNVKERNMKKSGLPIVLALGLGCHHQAGLCRQAPPFRYAAKEVRRETRVDGPPCLSRPVALVCDDLRIFVLDMDDHDIKVFSRLGEYESTIGRKGQGPGEFHLPSGLDILGGRLYVADAANRRIQVLDTKGGYISGFRVPFSPHRVLALGRERIVVMSLPSGRGDGEKLLHGYDGKGELLWEAEDSFFSRDSVYDLMRNRWFIVRAAGKEFFLVPGSNGRLVRRLDADGALLCEIEVSRKYPSQELEIPAGEGKRRTLSAFCWNCASDREKLFLLVPERTGDGDLGPGRTIAVVDQAGALEATITLPERLTRIAVNGATIFGLDMDAALRIFKVERE
jgi:hypothetical protein